jgi:hypothetical protein
MADDASGLCTDLRAHRTAVLAGAPWVDIDFAPDVPLLMYQSLVGQATLVPEARFYQWVPRHRKLPEERSRANSLRRLRRFRFVRLSRACAVAARKAEEMNGRRHVPAVTFVVIYCSVRVAVTKAAVFEVAPAPVQSVWRRLKYGRDDAEAIARP